MILNDSPPARGDRVRRALSACPVTLVRDSDTVSGNVWGGSLRSRRPIRRRADETPGFPEKSRRERGVGATSDALLTKYVFPTACCIRLLDRRQKP